MSQPEENKEEVGSAEYVTIDDLQVSEGDYALLAADVDARRRRLDACAPEVLAGLSATTARISIQIIPEDPFTDELVIALRDSSAAALCFMRARELVAIMHQEIERLKAIVGEASAEANNATKH